MYIFVFDIHYNCESFEKSLIEMVLYTNHLEVFKLSSFCLYSGKVNSNLDSCFMIIVSNKYFLVKIILYLISFVFLVISLYKKSNLHLKITYYMIEIIFVVEFSQDFRIQKDFLYFCRIKRKVV